MSPREKILIEASIRACAIGWLLASAFIATVCHESGMDFKKAALLGLACGSGLALIAIILISGRFYRQISKTSKNSDHEQH